MFLTLAGLIALLVNPTVCNAPCNVTITVKVEPAPDNAKVVIEFLDEDKTPYRISDLDYSNGGPKTLRITYPGVPGGAYDIVVSLHKHDGKSWVAGTDKKHVEVIARD